MIEKRSKTIGAILHGICEGTEQIRIVIYKGVMEYGTKKCLGCISRRKEKRSI